ncbi:MAG: hypothetical protein LBI82_07540 [Dysgonamonadaceae bacterium]|jgi:hypothetical protein|nr:hypothetical protein [Dysgonamonadaceae bacterium]
MYTNRLKMRNVIAIAICLAGTTMFSGCGNNLINEPNDSLISTQTATLRASDVKEIDGIYIGTYSWTNLTQNWSFSSMPTIELKDGKYTYKGLSNDSFYDRGSGNYTIEGTKIIFELKDCAMPMQAIGVIDSWLLEFLTLPA